MNNKTTIQVLLGTVLLLTGVILGLLLRGPSYQDAQQRFEKNHTARIANENQMPTSGAPNSQAPNKHQTIIPNLGLSSEWISNIGGLNGFSLFFDNLPGGLFLLEVCEALTYVDEKGKPAAPNHDFCKIDLKGSIVGVKEDSFIILSESTNQEVQVKIELTSKKMLRMTYEGKNIEFKNGSRNDLLQQFENHPKTLKAKEKMTADR